MSIKACVFDLDGTLLNTLDDLAKSLNRALRDHSFLTRSTEEVRQFVGNGMRTLVMRAAPQADENQAMAILADFMRYYSAHMMEDTAPYPGMLDLLETLQLSGYPLAVLSNKRQEATEALIHHYFPGVFAPIYGERPGVAKKPAPDGIYAIADLWGLSPHDMVYIGDSEVDVHTARAIRMPLIACTWGFRDQWVLEKAGAETFAHEPADIFSRILQF